MVSMYNKDTHSSSPVSMYNKDTHISSPDSNLMHNHHRVHRKANPSLDSSLMLNSQSTIFHKPDSKHTLHNSLKTLHMHHSSPDSYITLHSSLDSHQIHLSLARWWTNAVLSHTPLHPDSFNLTTRTNNSPRRRRRLYLSPANPLLQPPRKSKA
jgi:hypothetical protein